MTICVVIIINLIDGLLLFKYLIAAISLYVIPPIKTSKIKFFPLDFKISFSSFGKEQSPGKSLRIYLRETIIYKKQI